MKVKTFRNLLKYSSLPITLIVLSSDSKNIRIEYDKDDFDAFKNAEDFNDYEIVFIITSKYFVDIFIKK